MKRLSLTHAFVAGWLVLIGAAVVMTWAVQQQGKAGRIGGPFAMTGQPVTSVLWSNIK